jgi:two-component system cell cycle sensor histidine kinase/response regulator CckA
MILPPWLRSYLKVPGTWERADESRRAEVLHIAHLSIFFGGFLYVFLPSWILNGQPIYILATIVISAVGSGLLRAGRVKWSGIWTTGAMWLMFTAGSTTEGGVTSGSFAGTIAMVVFAGLAYGETGSIVISFMSVLAGGAIVYLKLHGLLPAPDVAYSDLNILADFTVYIAITALFTTTAIRRIESSTEQYEAELMERQRAEQSLREAEERFRSMYENSTIGLYRTTPNGKILLANPSLVKMLGYSSSEELTTRNLEEEGFEPSYERKQFIQRIETEGEVKGLESAWTRKDGTTVYVRESAKAIHDSSGVTLFFDGTVEDITERIKTEEALVASETKLRAILENSVDAIGLHVNGIWEMCNPAALRLFGASSAEELIGTPILNVIAPEERTRIGNFVRSRNNGAGAPSTYITRGLRADGTKFDLDVTLSLFSMDTRQYILVILRDITERRRTEEALRESEEKYRNLFDNMDEGFSLNEMIMDASGNPVDFRILNANRAYGRHTGLNVEEIEGKTILEIMPEVDQKQIEAYGKVAMTGEPFMMEYFSEAFGRHLRVRAFSPQRGRFATVFEDITDKKRAEEALRQAQKLESIGTLAGGIAHDFNNLLNAILGQSALAARKLPTESPARNHIEKSIKAAERAADLTRQMLAYSGKGKFVTQEIDLNSLLKENAQMLETSVPKTCELKFDLGSPSPHILGDVGQIQQVIMNLIINAGEAIGQDPGSITLRTNRIMLDDRESDYWEHTNAPHASGYYALLEVRDTGSGIKAEHLERIFDPFFTTKFTGRGLGLAAVLGIIRGHHGGIRIRSKEGSGTSFEIVFPIIDPVESSVAHHPQREHLVEGTNQTILVIDDEPFVLEVIKDVLNDSDFNVIGSLNPLEGIELYKRNQAAISVVILDYSMPNMDGKAAFAELLKINKDVKVLLCSGYSEDEMESLFGDVRPRGFIQKPYQPSALLARVSQLIADQVR